MKLSLTESEIKELLLNEREEMRKQVLKANEEVMSKY